MNLTAQMDENNSIQAQIKQKDKSFEIEATINQIKYHINETGLLTY